jgi:integrase
VSVLKDFAEYFPADFPVTALTTAHVRDYFAKRRPKIAPGTVNRELGYISAALRAAEMYFPELENWKPPRLPYGREPEGRDRPLTLDEAHRLIEFLRTAPVHRRLDREARLKVADLLSLALMTGMRLGEWLKRKRSDFDLQGGTVRLTKTKTGKARTLLLTPPVGAIVERRIKEAGASPFLFSGAYHRDRPMLPYSVTRALKYAAAQLKIPYGRGTEGGFTFHDTRHTAVSNMLLAGHDLATVADISGHSKKTMALRYSHATAESRARALQSLEKFDFRVSVAEKQQAESEAKLEES